MSLEGGPPRRSTIGERPVPAGAAPAGRGRCDAEAVLRGAETLVGWQVRATSGVSGVDDDLYVLTPSRIGSPRPLAPRSPRAHRRGHPPPPPAALSCKRPLSQQWHALGGRPSGRRRAMGKVRMAGGREQTRRGRRRTSCPNVRREARAGEVLLITDLGGEGRKHGPKVRRGGHAGELRRRPGGIRRPPGRLCRPLAAPPTPPGGSADPCGRLRRSPADSLGGPADP